MREVDFSKVSLGNRWFGAKGIRRQLQGEVKCLIKSGMEGALVLEQRVCVGCSRSKRRQEP